MQPAPALSHRAQHLPRNALPRRVQRPLPISGANGARASTGHGQEINIRRGHHQSVQHELRHNGGHRSLSSAVASGAWSSGTFFLAEMTRLRQRKLMISFFFVLCLQMPTLSYGYPNDQRAVSTSPEASIFTFPLTPESPPCSPRSMPGLYEYDLRP